MVLENVAQASGRSAAVTLLLTAKNTDIFQR